MSYQAERAIRMRIPAHIVDVNGLNGRAERDQQNANDPEDTVSESSRAPFALRHEHSFLSLGLEAPKRLLVRRKIRRKSRRLSGHFQDKSRDGVFEIPRTARAFGGIATEGPGGRGQQPAP